MTTYKDMPIEQFCQGHSQKHSAKLLGISEAYMSRIINSDRGYMVRVYKRKKPELWYRKVTNCVA